ncbi:MAG: recombinase family protein, partial [Lacipirellulaceae bacterium]
MICRVSSPGEGKQREESNDDQEVRLRDYLEQQWDGPTMIEVIAGVGSGEDVQREELYKAELAVETGEYDLILCEDLSRISRRYHAQRFCELAEDFDTRLIAVNGDVDTGQPN